MSHPRSLRFRLVAGLAAWTVVALTVSGLVLSSLNRADARAAFSELLLAQAYNVMGSLSRNDAGKLEGRPNMGDPRFVQPLSGWYWAVRDGNEPVARSVSLSDATIETDAEPYDESFRRLTSGRDMSGTELLVLEAQLRVDRSDSVVTVQVAAPVEIVDEQAARFDRSLLLFFVLFGSGLLIATVVAVSRGLAPLSRLRTQLAAVRAGERERLDDDLPPEIAPIVRETNALLESNRSVIERARAQVGNLAHGLKTPLAVMQNESRGSDARSTLFADQIGSMRRQIDTYLNRARIAAVRNSAASRTPMREPLEGLTRVIGRLNPDVDVSLELDANRDFAGERQDFEEVVGNLLENAGRHARSAVSIRVSDSGSARIVVVVEDDGPGVPETERSGVLSRGVRLDEARKKYGSGLGLSIVCEIVEAYDGTIALDASTSGGLLVRVELPAVERGL